MCKADLAALLLAWRVNILADKKAMDNFNPAAAVAEVGLLLSASLWTETTQSTYTDAGGVYLWIMGLSL